MSIVQSLRQWLFRFGRDEQSPIVLTQRRIFIVPSGAGLLFVVVLCVMLLGAIFMTFLAFRRHFVPNDVVAQVDALIADEHGRASDEFLDLMLAFAAERAVKRFFAGGAFFLGHGNVALYSVKSERNDNEMQTALPAPGNAVLATGKSVQARLEIT